MKFSFGVYDFLGYSLPGLMIIIVGTILINPTLPTDLIDQLKSTDDELPKYLRPTITQGIFYVVACYVVGLASHGFINWMFRVFSTIWDPFKRYYSDHGVFEKELFDFECRSYPEDYYPYSDQFVHKLRHQIRKVFDIKVSKIQCEAADVKTDVKYTEIFHLCRTGFMKHSPYLYPRASRLLSLYNSAKLLAVIFCLAAVGFSLRIVISEKLFQNMWIVVIVPIFAVGFLCPCLIIVGKFFLWLEKNIWSRIKKLWTQSKNENQEDCEKNNENTTKKEIRLGLSYGIVIVVLGLIAGFCLEFKIDYSASYGNLIIGGIPTRIPIGDTLDLNNLFVCYCVSASLCPIFVHLYHLFFRYYRNTILYGFYEYAIDPERSKEKSQSEE